MKKEYFTAAGADVYGNVRLAKDSSIWFQSILEGDSNTIAIDEGNSVQDGTIIHVNKDAPTIISRYVAMGHQCMLHGCKIGDGALIGMGSIILSNAIIGGNSLIGTGSLVTEGKIILSNVLAFGRSAKVTRSLAATEIASSHMNALHYVQRAEELRQQKYPKLTWNWEENDEEN